MTLRLCPSFSNGMDANTVLWDELQEFGQRLLNYKYKGHVRSQY